MNIVYLWLKKSDKIFTMTNQQIKRFHSLKNIDKTINEYEQFGRKTPAFIGKKKSFEGLLLQLESISGRKKGMGKNDSLRIKQLFALLEKTLGDINSLVKVKGGSKN